MEALKTDIEFTATPYRISTNTATGTIGTFVDLNLLFDHAELITASSPETGIVFIEYGRNKTEIVSKGTSPNKRKNSNSNNANTNRPKMKRFDNQATTVIKIFATQNVYVNMKVFNNGKVQMTGIKNIDDGVVAMNCLINVIKKINVEHAIVDDSTKLKADNYTIHLINSDFKTNFEVKRDVLHRILVDNYQNKCTYEPCIYPGVKLQYYWKEEHDGSGNCRCEVACTHKKKTLCKKITIAIFQSGCVIITGANQINQLNDCYKYICNILKTHMNEIRKKQFVPKEEVVNRKIWVLKEGLHLGETKPLPLSESTRSNLQL